MKTTTSTIFVTLAMASAAFAQDNPGPPVGAGMHGGPETRRIMRMAPPPFDWWRNSEVAQKLNLTDQQKQQLEQTFTQARLQLVDLKGEVEKEEIKLQSLMNADTMQESQVMAQIDATQAARAKLEKTFAMMAFQFRKILTAEQWKQLQQQDMRLFHRRKGGMREGAMPPPGGPPND
jgi:Spy/CpxP family protein refolding chaperone